MKALWEGVALGLIIALLGALAYFFGQIFLFGLIVWIAIGLVIWEILSVVFTKKTISQNMRVLRDQSLWKFWTLLTVLMGLSWFLVFHFARQ